MRKIQLFFYSTVFIMFTTACVGCVNISYLSPTGESLTYIRLGTQEITGLGIAKDKEGSIKFELATQKGTEGKVLSDVAEAMKNITALKVP